MPQIFMIVIFVLLMLGHSQPGSFPKGSNLKVTNYTGDGITPQMVSYYIKTLNEAYIFHLEDL